MGSWLIRRQNHSKQHSRHFYSPNNKHAFLTHTHTHGQREKSSARRGEARPLSHANNHLSLALIKYAAASTIAHMHSCVVFYATRPQAPEMPPAKQMILAGNSAGGMTPNHHFYESWPQTREQREIRPASQSPPRQICGVVFFVRRLSVGHRMHREPRMNLLTLTAAAIDGERWLLHAHHRPQSTGGVFYFGAVHTHSLTLFHFIYTCLRRDDRNIMGILKGIRWRGRLVPLHNYLLSARLSFQRPKFPRRRA